MVKVFHHDDLDGHCAGNIIAWILGVSKKQKLNPNDFVEMNYDKIFPIDIIDEGEKVYIVDFSIEPEDMEKLLKKTKNVRWIDHHVTAIEKYENFPYKIGGKREIGKSGCVLAYELINPYGDIPDAVKYIGDRDVWDWAYGEETRFFCSGAELFDTSPLSTDWDILYKNSKKVKEIGKFVDQYKTQRNKEYLKKYGFIAEFEGHRANVVNVGMVGSEIFDSLEKKRRTPNNVYIQWKGIFY